MNKKTISIAITLILCLTLLLFVFTSCSSNMPKIDKKTGYLTFTKDKDEDFKILQFTDIHVSGTAASASVDKLALDAVEALVKEAQPDLIILTGDSTMPMEMYQGTTDNIAPLKMVAEKMETFEIPWTCVFGNHDVEYNSLYTKADLCDVLESKDYKYCIFDRGFCDEVEEETEPSKIYNVLKTRHSMGNSVIAINNANGDLNTALFLIDSNSYLKPNSLQIVASGGSSRSPYDYIHEEQINWYKEEVEKLNELPHVNNDAKPNSLAYFHIAVPEYITAINAYQNGDTSVINNYADYNFENDGYNENPCPSATNSGFFTAAKENGTTGMFIGHDHVNYYSLNYQGVNLTYGLSIDYHIYAGIANKTNQRGATLVSIANDASYTITPIRLVDIQ